MKMARQQKWRLELKMAESSEEQHGNPSCKNNSGEKAIVTARDKSKIKIKANKLERGLSYKMAKSDCNENS